MARQQRLRHLLAGLLVLVARPAHARPEFLLPLASSVGGSGPAGRPAAAAAGVDVAAASVQLGPLGLELPVVLKDQLAPEELEEEQQTTSTSSPSSSSASSSHARARPRRRPPGAEVLGRLADGLDFSRPPPQCTPQLIQSRIWGVASSAYQIEGAHNASGKSPSIWDAFTQRPGAIEDGSSGAVAIDHYHRYRDDYALMRQLGITSHRFSFSWSRVLPQGRAGSPVNAAGLAFYHALVDEMLNNGIEPVATIYHWDLPQVLQDEYGGFLSDRIVADFDYYAQTLFANFGSKVKNWITFNEPPMICDAGYRNGEFAPGVKGPRANMFRCGHNVLLAHAAAVRGYRHHFQLAQQGKIGITINVVWGEPLDPDSDADKRAVANKFERELGWLADPLFFGDYPANNKAALGADLPTFTAAQRAELNGSLDFLAVNVYTGRYVSADPNNPIGFKQTTTRNGVPIGESGAQSWMLAAPRALGGVLTHVGERYGRPETWVTEFGTGIAGEADWRGDQVLRDTWRIALFHSYLDNACRAITEQRLNVPRLYAWTLWDNFEWVNGYRSPYGLVHVNFRDGSLRRRVKDSGRWFARHFFSQGRRALGGGGE